METLRDPLLRVTSPTEVGLLYRPRPIAWVLITLIYLLGVLSGVGFVVVGLSGAAAGNAELAASATGLGAMCLVPCSMMLRTFWRHRRSRLDAVHVGGPERVLRFVERTPTGPRTTELPLDLFDRAFVQPIVTRSSESDGGERVSRSFGLCLAGPQIVWRIAEFGRLARARESLAVLQPHVRQAPPPSWSPSASEFEAWSDADGRHVRWSQRRPTGLPVTFALMLMAFAVCMVPAVPAHPTFVAIVWALFAVFCTFLLWIVRRMPSQVQVGLGAQEIVVHETRPSGVATTRTPRTEPLDVLLRVTDSATLTLADKSFNERLFHAEVAGASDPRAALAALSLMTDPAQQRPVRLDLGRSTHAIAIAVWHQLR